VLQGKRQQKLPRMNVWYVAVKLDEYPHNSVEGNVGGRTQWLGCLQVIHKKKRAS